MPWLRVITKLLNSFNYHCTHQNFCHPNCYRRQMRAARRIMEATRHVRKSIMAALSERPLAKRPHLATPLPLLFFWHLFEWSGGKVGNLKLHLLFGQIVLWSFVVFMQKGFSHYFVRPCLKIWAVFLTEFKDQTNDLLDYIRFKNSMNESRRKIFSQIFALSLEKGDIFSTFLPFLDFLKILRNVVIWKLFVSKVVLFPWISTLFKKTLDIYFPFLLRFTARKSSMPRTFFRVLVLAVVVWHGVVAKRASLEPIMVTAAVRRQRETARTIW